MPIKWHARLHERNSWFIGSPLSSPRTDLLLHTKTYFAQAAGPLTVLALQSVFRVQWHFAQSPVLEAQRIICSVVTLSPHLPY
jgi:hypothetical protein